MSAQAKDLITRLLTNNPQERITTEDLKNHPFFEGIDWKNIRKEEAPFVPQVSEITDTKYFDARNERLGIVNFSFKDDEIRKGSDGKTLLSFFFF